GLGPKGVLDNRESRRGEGNADDQIGYPDLGAGNDKSVVTGAGQHATPGNGGTVDRRHCGDGISEQRAQGCGDGVDKGVRIRRWLIDTSHEVDASAEHLPGAGENDGTRGAGLQAVELLT